MDLSDALEASVISIASKSVYGGAATAILAGLAKIDFLSAIGAIIAVLSLIINFYYRRRKDKREQAEHERRIAQMDLESQIKRDAMLRGAYEKD